MSATATAYVRMPLRPTRPACGWPSTSVAGAEERCCTSTEHDELAPPSARMATKSQHGTVLEGTL